MGVRLFWEHCLETASKPPCGWKDAQSRFSDQSLVYALLQNSEKVNLTRSMIPAAISECLDLLSWSQYPEENLQGN